MKKSLQILPFFMAASLSLGTVPAQAQTQENQHLNQAGLHQTAQESMPYRIVLPKNGTRVTLNGLQDQTGHILDDAYTAEHFKGKRLILYFGFPDCTSFCPPSTTAIMETAPQYKPDDFQFVFIASRTNPHTGADYTPAEMQAWLEKFGGQNIDAIALTGRSGRLQLMYKAMHVIDERGNHLPAAILINETGNLLGAVPVIRLEKKDGKKLLLPNPQSFQKGLEKYFGLKPLTPTQLWMLQTGSTTPPEMCEVDCIP